MTVASIIGNRRTGFEATNPENEDKAIRRLSQKIQSGLKNLSQDHINRMGIKCVKYVNLDLTFEQIRNQLRPLCLPINEKLEEATSSEIVDVALHFDYKWNDYTAMMRIGPMKAEQGREMLLRNGNIIEIFGNPNDDSSLSDFYASVPESFLYLDLDIYSKNTHKPDEWIPFVEKVTPHINEAFEKMIALVLECD